MKNYIIDKYYLIYQREIDIEEKYCEIGYYKRVYKGEDVDKYSVLFFCPDRCYKPFPKDVFKEMYWNNTSFKKFINEKLLL